MGANQEVIISRRLCFKCKQQPSGASVHLCVCVWGRLGNYEMWEGVSISQLSPPPRPSPGLLQRLMSYDAFTYPLGAGCMFRCHCVTGFCPVEQTQCDMKLAY